MYTIKTTGETTESFFAAINLAKSANSEVVDSNGTTRWTPAPPVSAKKMRRYAENQNARAAFEKARS